MDSPMDKEAYLFPTSFAQQRLWFLDQLVPGNPFYNVDGAIRFKAPLNVAVLEQSLNEIVSRHETLRTTFREENGEPFQVIALTLELPLAVVDLRDLPELEREAEAQLLATEEAQRPFDLAQGPLIRTTLLRLGEEDYVFLLTMHHIVTDGWSMGLFFSELTALYGAFSLGEPSPLTKLPIQYADFAVWQRQWLQGEVLEAQLAYWKEQLANLPTLHLPTDRTRPAVTNASFLGAHQSFVFPKPLHAALQELSQREGVTLFMTLLAAFQILLHRYSRQEDIVVGVPIANRNQPEIEGLIGFFVNTLVMRTDLSDNPTFRELLGRVREVALGAYDHQDLPFEMLVEELQPERDLRNPLAQVSFQLFSALSRNENTADLDGRLFEVERGTAGFDLSFDLSEGPQGLLAWVEYSTDLFDDATIARILGHFQTLLEGIVADPGQRLSGLPLLTEAEQHQLLVEWNDTRADFPKDSCIHQLFEAQVQRTPNALAVVCEDQHLTYEELNHRANQLAHRLQTLGVGPEVLVGICMERSVAMLVGLLGILKAGGGYVPLDLSYPKERLRFILEDTQAKVVLTQEHLVDSIPVHHCKLLCLDSGGDSLAAESQGNPPSPVSAENLAYVIYTSGSTGMPKGVLITHRSLVNHSIAVAQRYAIEAADRILQFASISFDVAAEELFPSWSCGATVVLQPQRLLATLGDFEEFVERERLSVLNLPSSYWHLWVDEIAGSESPLPPTLRSVIVGSENVSPEKYAIWQRLAQDRIRFYNAYGPTEATITSTIYDPAVGGDHRTVHAVPIGRPIANTQIYLLDQHLNPMPIGVPGELYIGGDGLARGYLNLPELTADRFISNPFSHSSGARLYKTGDLARYLPDGNIEFLGRTDNQVKVRGFRIELEEIETVLKQHPVVQEVVVVANDRSRVRPLLETEHSGISIGPEDVGILAQQISSLDRERAYALLAEVEEMSEDEIDLITSGEMLVSRAGKS